MRTGIWPRARRRGSAHRRRWGAARGRASSDSDGRRGIRASSWVVLVPRRPVGGAASGWRRGLELEARPRRSGQQAWIDRPRCHVLAQARLRVPRPAFSCRHGNSGLRPVHRQTRLECACRPLREHLRLAESRAPTNEILSSRVRGDHGRLQHGSHRRRLRLGSRVDECHPRRFEVGRLPRDDRYAVYDDGCREGEDEDAGEGRRRGRGTGEERNDGRSRGETREAGGIRAAGARGVHGKGRRGCACGA